jgi:hypothetical protein
MKIETEPLRACPGFCEALSEEHKGTSEEQRAKRGFNQPPSLFKRQSQRAEVSRLSFVAARYFPFYLLIARSTPSQLSILAPRTNIASWFL